MEAILNVAKETNRKYMIAFSSHCGQNARDLKAKWEDVNFNENYTLLLRTRKAKNS